LWAGGDARFARHTRRRGAIDPPGPRCRRCAHPVLPGTTAHLGCKDLPRLLKSERRGATCYSTTTFASTRPGWSSAPRTPTDLTPARATMRLSVARDELSPRPPLTGTSSIEALGEQWHDEHRTGGTE
jgi:hypothetical protein